ncbi:hypothetical protein LCL97_02985 [Seohaeicola saemankumensis]|nr:hypothetical protein [Seohaeicola saemankumensis]MCA0869780.1 hypothetical protein [Seohaeicola saemankumensis]
MDNITGLMVALMFVTLLTIGFGNLLGAIAPRLATPKGFADQPLDSLWWAILGLIVLDTFWRCTVIFSIENWSFAEFLFVQLGAIMLFFASTCLPSETPPARLFFACMAVFQLWVLGLGPVFGPPPVAALVVALLMAVPPAAIAMRPTPAVYRPATVTMAGLTVLSLFV